MSTNAQLYLSSLPFVSVDPNPMLLDAVAPEPNVLFPKANGDEDCWLGSFCAGADGVADDVDVGVDGFPNDNGGVF